MQIDTFAVKTFPSIDTVGSDSGDWPVRVCIVTEEIIGPVRNGGIASTYYHLSKGLAAHGHDVHVLFLKGAKVQDETPEHWVDHFAAFGVTLHYLEVPPGPKMGTAIEWQERFMAAYRWLRDRDPFDVVHTSEWRGGTVYALMAKRLGLAFPETLFLVKTSSPHIWNRHYQMQPIEKSALVTAAYAEQKCVELADMVIGGSAHLITFMEEIGYKLPPANVFVQPNIVDFSNVPVDDKRGPRAPGDIVKTRELIFFGRLEGRKGVEIFAGAIDLLHERGDIPERITFMGKWGAPLATQGNIAVQEYLEAKAAAWSCPVDYITDQNQPGALSYMCSRDMIAVMPSLIENSTMAVYETLEKRIPFIATAVGGTPELIDPADHDTALVPPRAVDLADRLQAALRDGQPIAHPGFSNDANLETWYGFHAWLGHRIADEGRAAVAARLSGAVDPAPRPVAGLGYGALMRRGDDPAALVAALIADRPDRMVLAFTDATLRDAAQGAVAALEAAGIEARRLDCIGQTAGDALNMLADALGTDAMVLSDGLGVCPRPGYMAAARTALAHRPDALFTTFFQTADGTLGMPLGGDVATQFQISQAYGPETIALRDDTRKRLGPFEPYDVRHGLIHELVTRQALSGVDDLLVCPEVLMDWPDALREGHALADNSIQAYLKAKPLLDAANLPLRKVLLAALSAGGSGGGGGGNLNPANLRDGGRGDGTPLWLMPADWDRDDIDAIRGHRLIVGLDETANRLLFHARGPGRRALLVRDIEEPLEDVAEWRTPTDEPVTLSVYDIPPAWEIGQSYPLRWEVQGADDQIRSRFLRVTKLGRSEYALTCRETIVTPAVLHALSPDAPRGPGPGKTVLMPEQLRDGGRDASRSLWLMPADWAGGDLDALKPHALAIAVDTDADRLLLAARGPGTRRLFVDDVEHPADIVPEMTDAMGKDRTVSRFDIPDDWAIGTAHALRWERHDGDDTPPRSRFLKITKLGARDYALSCREPVLSPPDLARLWSARVRAASGPIHESFDPAGGDPVQWLMPAHWNRAAAAPVRSHRLHVGIDPSGRRLWLLARGTGTRVLRIDGTPAPLTEIEHHRTLDGETLTLSAMDLPEAWILDAPCRMSWRLEDADSVPLRIRDFKIACRDRNSFSVTCNEPVLAAPAIRALINWATRPPEARGGGADNGVRQILRRARNVLRGRR